MEEEFQKYLEKEGWVVCRKEMEVCLGKVSYNIVMGWMRSAWNAGYSAGASRLYVSLTS